MTSDFLFEQVERIAKEPSRIEKQKLMIPALAQVFLYAYDPFKNYGVRQVPPKTNRSGQTFTPQTFQILGALADRTITGNKAKDMVNSLIFTLSPRSAELLKRILLKDLRCGVSIKSINIVYPGLVADGITMQPNDYTPEAACFPLLVSLKLRGVRGYYSHEKGGLFSRKGKPFFGLEHITDKTRPYGRNFDGELLVPGLTLEEGSGMVRNKDKTPQVKYCVFDTPDEHRPFSTRYNLYMLMLLHDQVDIFPVLHDEILDVVSLHNMYDEAIEQGYEGVVAKNPVSRYEPGKTNEWLKLKEKGEPLDLEVIDVYEGKNKNIGKLGGVVVLYNNHPVRVGGGFSDSDRDTYWLYPNRIVGKTIVVSYQEVTKHKSLRNPNFEGIRDDK